MNILVVEDDPRISDVLEYALKSDGHQVSLTQRGREGVDLARSVEPALILLDVGLPDIDGFAICDRLKRNRETNLIPIIISGRQKRWHQSVSGPRGSL